MTAKHLILFLAFACNPIIALASECRMKITAKVDIKGRTLGGGL